MARRTFDRYPLSVEVDGVTHTRVRVVVTGGVAAMFGSGRSHQGVQVNGTIVEIARMQDVSVAQVSGQSRQWAITAGDGAVWVCRKEGGCGCGDPLKTWAPRL